MAGTMQVTTIIEREGGEYVFVCRELDIASQGPTVEKARDNLQEVIELFFETADPSEIAIRPGEVCVTRLEIAVGWFRVFSARELCRLPGDHGFELVGQRQTEGCLLLARAWG